MTHIQVQKQTPLTQKCYQSPLNIHQSHKSWCFEPSPPLRIISGLKMNSSLSFSRSVRKSLNMNHHNFGITQFKYFI